MANILNYFPFQSFRPYQKEVLLEFQEAIDSWDYIFCEAPTGAGKSALGYTLAKYLLEEQGGLSHIVVADKFLQRQYLSSFPDIVQVMGRNNFECSLPMFQLDKYFRKDVEPGKDRITCDRAPCTLSTGYKCPHKPRPLIRGGVQVKDQHGVIYQWEQENPDAEWWEVEHPYCPYWVQKDAAIRSNITISNYAYFLHENTYSGAFTKRLFGVLDESHLAESFLMNFIQEDVTRWTLRRVSKHFPSEGISEVIPDYDNIGDWKDWLEHICGLFSNILDKFGSASELSTEISTEDYAELDIRVLMKNTVERLTVLIADIIDDPENWVWIRDERRVLFKPVTIAKYSGRLFNHMEKKLLMSATILDHEMLGRYLGVEKEDIKFIRVSESTFPIKNRPLIQDYQGKATHKTMDAYLSKMLQRIDDYYIPNKMVNKGVVHTHSHKIARYILANSKYKNMMVSNTDNEGNRDEIFQEFFDSKPPKVMVSCSMDLGVDLFDERCRWQLICKIPYPDMNDPQIKKRMEREPDWYDYRTVVDLIQTYGRACRSETDWAETYVLDSMFAWLVSKNKSIIPKWFMEAIR